MFLLKLLGFKTNCSHEKVAINLDFSYCPDCGKLIKNEWYITRCACCGVKMKAINKNSEIYPQNRFCSNCGSEEYIVEKIDKINFIDINYAVLNKTICDDAKQTPFTQCWEEKRVEKPKLLTQYL